MVILHARQSIIPFTTTIPVIGIHSLEPSGNTFGLLRVGSASKCAWTKDAIREGNAAVGFGSAMKAHENEM